MLIVPVMLDDEQQPDYRYMDAAVAAIAPGVHAGSTVIFETTLPVGDTRGRYAPRLEAGTGLRSTERGPVRRVLAGAAVQRRRAPQPGHLPEARRRARPGVAPTAPPRSTTSVLDAEVVAMSSAEAAEFAKLADTTYRDVNIALANEFAATPTGSASTSPR